MYIKNKIISNIVQIISLILVILFTIFIIKPAKDRLQNEIVEKRDEIFQDLENKTGLTIEYGSISPLIIDSLVIKNISVFSKNKNQNINISKITIKFSLLNLIITRWKKIDAPTVISAIYIDEGSVSLDFKDMDFFTKFDGDNPSNSYFKGKIYLNKIDVDLDFDVLKIQAYDTFGSISGRFSRYYADITTNGKYITKLDIPFNYFAANVGFKGYLSRDFKDINSRVNLKEVNSDIGTIKDLEAELKLNNSELNIKNSDKSSNFDYQYILRIPILENYFNIKTDNFKIRDIFTPNSSFNLLDNYLDSILTGNIDGSNSFFDNSLLYHAEGNLIHYDNNLSLSLNSKFNLVGDLDNVTFKDFNVSTNYGYLAFIGSLDLNNFFPQGNFYLRNGKIGEQITLDSNFNVKVINDNFINLNFDYIEGNGVRVSNISSILFIDKNDISFQGLKKDGDEKISLSGNYNISNGSINSSISVQNLKLRFLEPILGPSIIKDKVEGSRISFNAALDYSTEKLNYNVDDLVLSDNNTPFIQLEGQGIDNSFSVDYLKIDLPDIDIQGRITGEILNKNIKLNLDTLINDYKYNIDLEIADNIIKGSGNYGLDFKLALGETLYADFKSENLPIQFRDNKIKTSLDFKSAFLSDGSFLLSVPKFEISLENENLPFKPSLSFTVDGSDKQIYINDIIYKDDYSPLKGDIKFIQESSGAYSVFATLSGTGSEKIELQSMLSLDTKSLSLDLNLNNFLLERLYVNGLNGRGSTDITFNGDMDKFNAEGTIQSNDLLLSTNAAGLNLNFSLNEELLKISDLNINLNNNFLSLPILTYNYKEGSLLGKINTAFKIGELDSSSGLALDLNFKPIEHLLKITSDSFSTFNGKVTLQNLITGDEELFSNKVFRIFNNSSALQIYSLDRYLKLFYSYKSGLINGKISKPYISAMNLTGTIKDGNMDVSVRDLDLDASIVNMFFGIGTIKSLDLHGQLNIEGAVSSPVINGLLWSDLNLTLDNIPEKIEPVRINIRAEENRFTILDTTINIGKTGKLSFGGELLFDSWIPESIIIRGIIPLKNKVPVKYQYGQIIVETNIYTPEITYYMDDSGSLISGRIVIDEGEYYTTLLNVTEVEEKVVTESITGIEVDMIVEVGVSNKLYWPTKTVPVVDATLKSGDEVNIKYKSVTGEFNVDGKLSIISGEVDYSGNPFYLREGSVALNLSNDQVNPYIKLLASKTVVDDNDRQVEVYLSFEGGFFSDFKPTFSASDASKTEDEISSLIGTAVTGDSFGELIFDVADEVATSYITAPFEQGLKEIINVDDVKIKSGFISALLTNITNNSFDSTDDTSYTVAEMFSETSLTIGNFVTDDFFAKLSIGSIYEDSELNPDVNLGFTLYAPHFQLGFNLTPQLSEEYVFEPELELSLEWVFTPGN